MVVLMIWELSKLLICLLKCGDVYCFRTCNVQYNIMKSYTAVIQGNTYSSSALSCQLHSKIYSGYLFQNNYITFFVSEQL